MNTEKMIDLLAAKNEAKREQGDYVKDGLLYCGHCETPKQCRIRFNSSERIVGCQCACARRKWEADKKADEERERAIYIKHLRANGIQDRGLTNCRFETATPTEDLAKCRRYVDHWEEMQVSNSGLLLWGNTGNGKSYGAACIVNELIDRGVPAMITSFPRILNAGWDKQEIAEQMRHYRLLVIDDLGAERSSEAALETVYMVIDERYKAKRPLIVTTNLTLKELCSPRNMDYQRIYDRILEMCVPVEFKGDNARRKTANAKFARARELLEGV